MAWANVEEALRASQAANARMDELDAELEATRAQLAAIKRAREKTEAEIERLERSIIDLLVDISGLQARSSHEAGMPAEVAVSEERPEVPQDYDNLCLLEMVRDTFWTPPLSSDIEDCPPPCPAQDYPPPSGEMSGILPHMRRGAFGTLNVGALMYMNY